jgi:hypothetical protein
MKINFPKLLSIVAISAILASCNSGNKVVSSFGKRKYTKGFFFNKGSHKNTETPVVAVHKDNTGKPAAKVENSTPRISSTVTENSLSTQPIITSHKVRKSLNLLSLPKPITEKKPNENVVNTNAKSSIQSQADDGVPGHGGVVSSGDGKYDGDAKTGLAFGAIGVISAIVLLISGGSIASSFLIIASIICACFGLGFSISGLKSEYCRGSAVAGMVFSILTIAFWAFVYLLLAAIFGGI